MRLLAARRPLHTDISFPHLSFSSSPSAKIGKESEPPRKRKSSTPPTPADRAGGSRLGGGEKKSRRSRGAAEMSSHHQQQVRASHILIKHEGSRRKASWKDPDGVRIRSTTRESAVAQLKALREEITSGEARFEDVAARRSDCSSAKRGGDLGPFKRGQMQKPFEEVAFALKVGEISDIVDTDSGVHIIWRTE